MCLLVFCCKPQSKLNHHCRVLEPCITADAARAADVGNGWKTSQRRLRFLEKNSIVMCRGNADMIRRATPYQKAVAIRRAG